MPYLYQCGYGLPEILSVVWLLSEDVVHHLGQELGIPLPVQYTDVKQLRHVKQEILVQNLSKYSGGQEGLLEYIIIYSYSIQKSKY